MTITNQTNKTIQAGNGTTATFNFAFPIFQASDLKVYKYLTSSTETTHTPLTITTDYTVVISSTTEGGSVTFVITPLATETIAIVRDLAYTQTTDIDLNGNFPEVDVENALDKNDMLAIQLKEQVDRALTISQFSNTTIGDIETPEDRRALIFSDNGDGTFDIVNSEYDPDANVASAASYASAAASSASSASSSASSATSSASAASGYATQAEAARDVAIAATTNKVDLDGSNATFTSLSTTAISNLTQLYPLNTSYLTSNGEYTLSDDWDNYKEIIIVYGTGTSGHLGEKHFTFYTNLINASDSTTDFENKLDIAKYGGTNIAVAEFNLEDTDRTKIRFGGSILGDDDHISGIYGRYKIS